ncbi:MAG: hypothetical protein DRN03_03300 [Thermoplasmata archaeon]|nr:MAG: hypothetical protein DRN03_03300 [Thermoplasmata archaeon]
MGSMLDSLKIIARDIGSILIIVGIATLPSLIVPAVFAEYEALPPFGLTCIVYLCLGAFLYLLCRKAGETKLRHAMSTAALGWLIVSLIGAIPFLFMSESGIGIGMDLLSAIFESVSGWTGTGLTMVVHENNLPHSLQFWRTLIQWIGGVGVIVLTIAILARPGTGSFVLYRSEAREQKIKPSVISTVRTIWKIYIIYTIAGVVALAILGKLTDGGMGIWEAVNHAMTAIATGGFSVTDNSMASYNLATQITIMFLMVLGAIAFVAHYDLLNGKVKKFFSDAQTRALLILIFVGSAILILVNLKSLEAACIAEKSFFQFISAITCTGFSTADISQWNELSKTLLSLAMITGGAAGSTAGGIKLFRFILLLKGTGWRIIKSLSSPYRVIVYRFGKKSISVEEAFEIVNESAIITFMWLILLFVGTFVISYTLPERTITDVFFEVCSAQGNVGLTCGITNPSMPDLAKIMLILNMWIGRLEIIPVLVLLRSITGRE